MAFRGRSMPGAGSSACAQTTTTVGRTPGAHSAPRPRSPPRASCRWDHATLSEPPAQEDRPARPRSAGKSISPVSGSRSMMPRSSELGDVRLQERLQRPEPVLGPCDAAAVGGDVPRVIARSSDQRAPPRVAEARQSLPQLGELPLRLAARERAAPRSARPARRRQLRHGRDADPRRDRGCRPRRSISTASMPSAAAGSDVELRVVADVDGVGRDRRRRGRARDGRSAGRASPSPRRRRSRGRRRARDPELVEQVARATPRSSTRAELEARGRQPLQDVGARRRRARSSRRSVNAAYRSVAQPVVRRKPELARGTARRRRSRTRGSAPGDVVHSSFCSRGLLERGRRSRRPVADVVRRARRSPPAPAPRANSSGNDGCGWTSVSPASKKTARIGTMRMIAGEPLPAGSSSSTSLDAARSRAVRSRSPERSTCASSSSSVPPLSRITSAAAASLRRARLCGHPARTSDSSSAALGTDTPELLLLRRRDHDDHVAPGGGARLDEQRRAVVPRRRSVSRSARAPPRATRATSGCTIASSSRRRSGSEKTIAASFRRSSSPSGSRISGPNAVDDPSCPACRARRRHARSRRHR